MINESRSDDIYAHIKSLPKEKLDQFLKESSVGFLAKAALAAISVTVLFQTTKTDNPLADKVLKVLNLQKPNLISAKTLNLVGLVTLQHAEFPSYSKSAYLARRPILGQPITKQASSNQTNAAKQFVVEQNFVGLKDKSEKKEGTFKSKLGLFTGIFENDIPKKGTLTKPNGEVFNGEFDEKGQPKTGILTRSNGEVFNGEFDEKGQPKPDTSVN